MRWLTLAALGLGCGAVCGQQPAAGTATSGQSADAGKPVVVASPGDHLDSQIKKGSEQDVDAVGTRKIGGRGMRNWYSTNWELSVGRQYSM